MYSLDMTEIAEMVNRTNLEQTEEGGLIHAKIYKTEETLS